ncbi:hypothetical protein [Paenibacillus lautus]|uniref:hypothetical protein n=1 Tax=Paenibacillus lautus TaxID=1401 RepID=UPI001C7DC910|nr:hypothetical protein [Paenibacillus lautus]MBX4152269.1 hypothetical protein [Paenibacillus lautus]
MNKDELRALEEDLHFTGYARNKVKAMGNEVADITSKIEILSGIVEEGLLKDELYRSFVLRQRKEIKDIIAQIYSYLHLEKVKGHYDHVFKESE